MTGRFYPIFVADPMKGPIPEDVIEKYGLHQFGADISATTISNARGIGWPMLYKAVSLTKQGKNYKEEWSTAATKGTDIHSVAEDLALWGIEDFDPCKYPEEFQGFCKALMDWWKQEKPKVIDKEFVTWSRTHGFAGRADLYCKLRKPMSVKEEHVLIDWKTVGDSDKFEKYPAGYLNNRCELVARVVAMREAGRTVDKCALVRLAPDGKFHHYTIPNEDYDDLFQSFLRMKAEYEFKEKHDPGSL